MLTFDHGAAELAPVAIGVPILGAPVLLVLGRRAHRSVVDVVSLAFAAATAALCALLFATAASGRVVVWAAAWAPHRGESVGVVLVMDPVGTGIALSAACLMLLALVHSQRYVESVHGHYHCLMLLFLGGMVGLALSGDAFDMFGFFELMGAATYALTGMKVEEGASLHGALNFGIINSLGAYVSLMGIGLLFARTGRLDLPGLGRALGSHRPDALVVCAFCLVVTGFLVKAAIVPFHFWLADAHAVAPAPVCLLFTGAMLPLGVYATFRLYWVVFGGTLPLGDARRLFIVLGVATALVGAVMALLQRHVKRLLSYCTIAHGGLFMVGMGSLSAAGTSGALLYAAGYAGAAGALFLVAGNLLGVYHSVDESRLHGRARDRRASAVLFVIGGLAVAALPPFATALGRQVSTAAVGGLGYAWAPALFVAVPALTGGAVLRAGARVFFGLGPRLADGGSAESEPGTTLDRVPWSMAVPPVVLLAASLALGLVPGVRLATLRAAAFFVDRSGYIAQALFGARAHAPAPGAGLAALAQGGGNWTGAGVTLGVLTAVLAVAVAAAALYGRPLVERMPPLRRLGAPARLLRALHSGHVGDYVAWMMVGIVVLAGFVGLPVR